MNQSTVYINPINFWSIPIPVRIITVVTRPPEGIPAAVNDAISVNILKS